VRDGVGELITRSGLATQGHCRCVQVDYSHYTKSCVVHGKRWKVLKTIYIVNIKRKKDK
jgi:hypothetical protein